MDKLNLQKLNDEDIALFKKWLYLDYVKKWYEHPLSWIDEMEKRHAEFCWIHHYIVTYGNAKIGFCQFYAYGQSGEDWNGNIPLDGTYSIDYLIGESAYLHRGIGTAIVKNLIQAIHAEPKAKRIIVKPDLANAASCNTLLSAGFAYDEVNALYLFTY